MIASINDIGGKIERVYYCPHDRNGDCSCRKPRPGMLLQASNELDIDLQDAVFIGDSITDLRAGLAAGIHAVLVLSGLGLDQFLAHHHEVNGPFRIGINLMHAAELVLKGLHVSSEMQTSLEHACYSFLGLHEQLDPRRIFEEQSMRKVTLTF
jgi:D-glycero-D-manno-heptose 1,7-bisphosphate phosphatase